MKKQTLFTNPQIIKLLEVYRPVWALEHMVNLADWDLNTYMPSQGANARGEAVSQVAVLKQQLYTDKNFVDLLEKAEKEINLNDAEKGVLRELRHSLKNLLKLPKSFVKEFAKVTNLANSAWVKAKDKQDFTIFQPHLEKIVKLTKQKVDYLGYKDHPYDTLLDEYEAGLTTKDVELFFDSYRQELQSIIKKIVAKNLISTEHPLEAMPYNEAKMVKINDKILTYLQADTQALRLDISAHPFTTGIASPSDVRITTRYAKNGFAESVLSTVHEFGHALYELQVAPDLAFTPIAGGVSLGLHESQSRFWENMIGRSRYFASRFIDDFKTLSPEINKYLTKHGVEGLYQYFNMVRPCFIRVEADELTYHFHIMLRFEIEKGLVTGDISVADLPNVWNAKMEEYLGIKPPHDSKGVLQDVHWSMGAIGYFPTYSTGSFLAAMWRESFEKEYGLMDDFLTKDDAIPKIKQWLKEKLHQYGATYTFKDLVKKSLGSDFVVEPMLTYLRRKYLS